MARILRLDEEALLSERTRLGCLLAVVVAAVVLPSAAFGAGGFGGVTVVAGPDLQGPPPPGVSKQADALAFYPRVVTVHVGDTVTWQFNGFNTVTFAGPKRPYPFVVPFPRTALGATTPEEAQCGGRGLRRCLG